MSDLTSLESILLSRLYSAWLPKPMNLLNTPEIASISNSSCFLNPHPRICSKQEGRERITNRLPPQAPRPASTYNPGMCRNWEWNPQPFSKLGTSSERAIRTGLQQFKSKSTPTKISPKLNNLYSFFLRSGNPRKCFSHPFGFPLIRDTYKN